MKKIAQNDHKIVFEEKTPIFSLKIGKNRIKQGS
jgi:hypothetical protein